MVGWILGALAVALATAAAVATGWWHYAFYPFSISTKRMTVRRLGLDVTKSADIERVDGILASFSNGFNAMIMKPTVSACQTLCDSLPVVYRPFAQEGVAMGYTLRQLLRYDPAEFEQRVVRPRPEYRYLYYVGLGFWSGMWNHSPARMQRVVEGLDPLHRYLCFDGYGFKYAFFDHPRNVDCLQTLDAFNGYARNAAYQGVGRAFYFRFMSSPDVLIRRLAELGDVAADAVAGVGLAAVFVHPDRMDVAFRLAECMPAEWRAHFHLGMCFAAKARAINDLDQFQQDVSCLDPAVQDAVYASIRECDRIELQVRAEGGADGYRQWRDSVAAWMAAHIVYPMVGLKSSDESEVRSPGSVNVTEEVEG